MMHISLTNVGYYKNQVGPLYPDSVFVYVYNEVQAMHTQALERLSTEQDQLLSWMIGHSLINKWPTQVH